MATVGVKGLITVDVMSLLAAAAAAAVLKC